MRMPLLALSVGAFGIGTTEFVVMGALSDIAESTGTPLSRAGLLVTAYALGVVIGAPLLTVATTRISRKRLLITLMACFAAANLATAAAPGFGLLLGARFAAGLPHGAFFGAAAVVGASLVPHHRRARAIAGIMSGLTVATIVGVPIGTVIAGQLSWRWVFVGIAAIGAAAAAAIAATVPDTKGVIAPTRPIDEVRALNSRRVILTLVTGAIGVGGMFACYTYLEPLLTEVTGMSAVAVAITLAVFGIGMTCGNVIGGQVADRFGARGLPAAFTAVAAVLTMMSFSVSNPVLAVGGVFMMAAAASVIGPILQRLLLDGADRAPSLASALHHSAFNIANANGAWLGGLAVGAGLGLTAPILVGAGLSLVGLGLAFALSRVHAGAPARSVGEWVRAS